MPVSREWLEGFRIKCAVQHLNPVRLLEYGKARAAARQQEKRAQSFINMLRGRPMPEASKLGPTPYLTAATQEQSNVKLPPLDPQMAAKYPDLARAYTSMTNEMAQVQAPRTNWFTMGDVGRSIARPSTNRAPANVSSNLPPLNVTSNRPPANPFIGPRSPKQ